MMFRSLLLVWLASFLVVASVFAREFRELGKPKPEASGRLIVHGHPMTDVTIMTDGHQLIFHGTNPELKAAGLQFVPLRSNRELRPAAKQAVAAVESGTSPAIRKFAVYQQLMPEVHRLNISRLSPAQLQRQLDALTQPYSTVLDSVRIMPNETLWYWKGSLSPEHLQPMPTDWVKPDPMANLQRHADEINRLLNEGYLIFISDGPEFRVPPARRELMLQQIQQYREGTRGRPSFYLPEQVLREVRKPTSVDQLRLKEE